MLCSYLFMYLILKVSLASVFYFSEWILLNDTPRGCINPYDVYNIAAEKTHETTRAFPKNTKSEAMHSQMTSEKSPV